MRQEKGFTLVELIIVCTLLVIIAAIAIPNINQILSNYKLDAAGHTVAGLLQQARMQAVKTNTPMYTQHDANGMVYFSAIPGAAYASGIPDVALPAGLTFQPPTVDHTQLDTYVGGVASIPASIAFNARGLPCAPNGAVCPSSTTGYEWFIQNPRGDWEAVTVTPSGRVKSWRMSSNSGGTAMWQ